MALPHGWRNRYRWAGVPEDRHSPQTDLTWAKTSYDSIHGTIATDWRIENGQIRLVVTIPPNTTATVYVPSRDPATVREAGGAQRSGLEGTSAVYPIGSGSYEFTGSW